MISYHDLPRLLDAAEPREIIRDGMSRNELQRHVQQSQYLA
jgi:hypothetical protein